MSSPFAGEPMDVFLNSLRRMEADECLQLSSVLAADVAKIQNALFDASMSGSKVIRIQIEALVGKVQKCMQGFSRNQSSMDNLCTLMYRDLVESDVRETLKELISELKLELSNMNVFLWLLYDNLTKELLSIMGVASESSNCDTIELLDSELQTLRYVGGFLVHKLKRRKSDLAQAVARALTDAGDITPIEEENLLEFTKMFVNEMDRGGLIHITDDFFSFLVEIELIVKRHFKSVSEDVSDKIKNELSENPATYSLWEKAAPEDTEDIRKLVIDLYVNLRINAFCKTLRFLADSKEKGKNRRCLRKTFS